MKTLLVGYDLNKAGQNYDALIEKLESFSAWWHYLDSTWLLKTDLTPVAVRDELRKCMDSNDELLVINVTGAEAAWLGFNAKGSQWLQDNL